MELQIRLRGDEVGRPDALNGLRVQFTVAYQPVRVARLPKNLAQIMAERRKLP